MDGRVKTLHPNIHGGLLGRRGIDDAVMEKHDIAPIDLLVVNLYPFAATVAKPDCTYADAIENIDIGGPAMVRAAAKNHESVTVVVDPADYAQRAGELDANAGATSIDTRSALAAKAFAHTARYDTMVSDYLLAREGKGAANPFPATLPLVFEKTPGPALRREPAPAGRVLSRARRRTGRCVASARACSRARNCRSTTSPMPTPRSNACACSTSPPASSSSTPIPAASPPPCRWPTPTNAPIAPTRPPHSAASSRSIASWTRPRPRPSSSRQFVEVIAAPSVSAEAAARAGRQAECARAGRSARSPDRAASELEYRSVVGGLLVQTRDTALAEPDDLQASSRSAAHADAATRTCGSPGACASS